MNNKFLFSIGTLLFNQLGVPYFLVKNSKQGLKTFVYGIITFGIVAIINTIKGILGGIKLFKMSAEDFAAADKVALINALPGDMNYKELIAAGKARLSKKKRLRVIATQARKQQLRLLQARKLTQLRAYHM